MQVFKNWRWSALAVVFGLAVPAARAGMITPDSIPNPPNAVASANGTPVYASNLVGTQYKGLGLNFPSPTVITRLNGISVWASVETEGLGLSIGGSPLNFPLQRLNYGWANIGFVSPGSSKPTTVSSMSVEILGNPPLPPLSMNVYDSNGVPLPISPVIRSLAGAQIWTFTGPGISSFSADQTTSSSQPWGVAEVSFTATSTPEPTSLFLAGLGVLGLAVRSGWRSRRTVA
jgi:hypothetical protein